MVKRLLHFQTVLNDVGSNYWDVPLHMKCFIQSELKYFHVYYERKYTIKKQNKNQTLTNNNNKKCKSEMARQVS